MGAYENPIAVIDRESGKIWANAISNLGNQAADVIETKRAQEGIEQKEAQIVLQQRAKYAMRNQAEFLNQMSKNGVNNPFLFETGKSLIDEMAKANSNVLSAKTQESSQIALDNYASLQKRYTGLVNNIKLGATADATFLADISNAKNPQGSQGGSSTSKPGFDQYQKIMYIRNGWGEGAVEKFKENDDGSYNSVFSGGILGDEIIDVSSREAYSFDPGDVINLDKEIMSILQDPSMEGKDGNLVPVLNKKGGYSQDYMLPPQVLDGDPNEKGLFVRSTIDEVDSSLVINSIRQPLFAKAQGILKDPEVAQAVWLEILGPEVSKNQRLKLDETGAIAAEDQKRFVEAIFERAKQRLPFFEVSTQEIEYQRTTSSKVVETKIKKQGGKPSKELDNAAILGGRIFNISEDLGFAKNEAGAIIGGQSVDVNSSNFESAVGKLGYTVVGVDEKGALLKKTTTGKAFEVSNGQDMDTFILNIVEAEGVGKRDALNILTSIQSQFAEPAKQSNTEEAYKQYLDQK